jgi:hypothetical protein
VTSDPVDLRRPAELGAGRPGLRVEAKRPVGSLPPSKPPPARHRSAPGLRAGNDVIVQLQIDPLKEILMWFRTLFDALKAPSSCTPGRQALPGPAPRRPAACRLSVEALGDRIVPASLTVSDVSVLEGNAGTRNAVVTVSLTGAVNSAVTVDYSTAHGTALAGSDYQAGSGTLTFNKGVTSKSILVPVIGDSLVEPDETFFVNLGNAKHATIADGQGVVTIVNDDTAIWVGDQFAAEGNSGTTAFTFYVTLSVAISQPVTVNFATADGTATGGSDYVAKTGKLTIPAGQTGGTITVLVNGDRLSEPDETFFMNLSSPTNGVVADGQGVGTIGDDEPHISISGASATEGNAGTKAFAFTVTLSTTSDAPVTVDYATTDDTATTDDNDYVAASGTVTFAPGETSKTITVLVYGDPIVEPDESFAVNLSNPTNAQLDASQAWGGIISDDNAVVRIDSVSGYEPNYGDGTAYFTFTVFLSVASNETVTVNYYSYDGSATAGYDYLGTGGILTFAPGETSQTITIPVFEDTLSEGTETFYVGLNATSSNALVQPGWGTGTGTIYDNNSYYF